MSSDLSVMLDRNLLQSLAIRPGPTGRFLERTVSGEPFFPVADTAWEIFHRLTREEVIEYLDNRKRRGVNVILGVLLPELDVKSLDGKVYTGEVDISDAGQVTPLAAAAFAEQDAIGTRVFYPNRYGETPLINDDPSTPNPKYFEHVDWVIQAAAERGIMFWLVPTWSRFTNSGWTYGPILFNDENARVYGTYVGNRYPFIPKLLGGDANPLWSIGSKIKARNAPLPFGEPIPPGYQLPNSLDLPRTDITALIQAMATGVVEAEKAAGCQSPFLTYHPCPISMPWSPEALASSFFGEEDWLTMDACQSGHSDCPTMQYDPPLRKWDARATHVPITKMWNSGRVRPVVDLESHYEQAHNGLRATGKFMWNEHDIRSGAWQSVLSGASGVVYGANVIWQMYSPSRLKDYPHHVPVCACPDDLDWKTSLELPGLDSLAILRKYFSSLPRSITDNRVPAQDLLVSSDAPRELQEQDARIDIMRDVQPGSSTSKWVIAHSGMGYGFVLDLVKAFCKESLEVRGEWLDPRTGSKQPIGIVGVDTAVRFDPPSKGSVKEDWVVLLTAPDV